MKARNPLDTGPVDTASEIHDDDFDPDWVELAAGRAVRVAGPPAILPARRPIELEAVTVPASLDTTSPYDSPNVRHAPPGRMYRSAHAMVLTIVLSFFASGTGMCAWVLVHR